MPRSLVRSCLISLRVSKTNVSVTAAQIVATFITAVVQVGIQQSLFDNVKDICSPHQAAKLTCPHTQVYFSSSAIWYAYVSRRYIIEHVSYDRLASGELLVRPGNLVHMRYTNLNCTLLRLACSSRFLSGGGRDDIRQHGSSTLACLCYSTAHLPSLPHSESTTRRGSLLRLSSVSDGFWFWFIWSKCPKRVPSSSEYVVRRRNFRWWSKFNYILSSALDSGEFWIPFYCFAR